MAKMKTFAIEVTITRKETLYVEARRPDGALALLKSQRGWADAKRYLTDCDAEDCTCDGGLPSTPSGVIIGTPRPVTP